MRACFTLLAVRLRIHPIKNALAHECGHTPTHTGRHIYTHSTQRHTEKEWARGGVESMIARHMRKCKLFVLFMYVCYVCSSVPTDCLTVKEAERVCLVACMGALHGCL